MNEVMAEAAEGSTSLQPHNQQNQQEVAHIRHPPSPSPSDPEEFIGSSTSGTFSQLPTQDTTTSVSPSSPTPALVNNPDYIALQSSLSLLNSQHRQVIEDMHTLFTLKEKALANPSWFKAQLMNGELSEMVPKKQNVVRCPRVEWEKYGSLGLRLGREIEKPAPIEPLYTVTLNFLSECH